MYQPDKNHEKIENLGHAVIFSLLKKPYSLKKLLFILAFVGWMFVESENLFFLRIYGFQ